MLLAARGSSGWIFGRDNVQQSFFLCVLPLSIFRAKVSRSGWLKEKQWTFKHRARGLFRSCLLKKQLMLFLIYYSIATCVYCWLFLKLASGCLFFWSLFFHHWFASVLSFVLQQDRNKASHQTMAVHPGWFTGLTMTTTTVYNHIQAYIKTTPLFIVSIWRWQLQCLL